MPGLAGVDRRRAARWWIAAGTFVVGVVVGGLVVGFAGWGSSSQGIAVTTTTAAGPALPTPAPGGSFTPGATGTVTVNTACLQALNDAQQAFGSIGELIGALRRFNAGQIDNVIQQLQPLQAQLQQELRACNVITTLPNGSLTTVTPGVSSPISIPTAPPLSSPESTPVPLSTPSS